MIKVIRKQVYQVTCSECKSDLEYDYGDIQTKMSSDYLGDKEIKKIIVCPVCLGSVTINKQDNDT